MTMAVTRIVVGVLLFLCVGFYTFAADSTPVPRQTAPTRKYFEVINGPATVLRYLNPQSPLLGLAGNYETFPIVAQGTSWCRIAYKGDTGWVEMASGKVVDSPTVTTSKLPGILLIVLMAVSVTLVLILGSIFVILSLRRQKFKRYATRRDVLIISPFDKEIRYSLTDAFSTVSKCFTEIGFKVSVSRDIDHARNLLVHYAPDVLFVDWQMDKKILAKIESILSEKESISSLILIFYNVPDPSETARRGLPANYHFIGELFSDRDIFKIVNPLILSGQSSHTFKKSVQSSALEGAIGSGNLVEVMQFIEIGKKTGCLYITLESPVGIIYFEQGRITYATAPNAQGRPAVEEILSMKEGHFHFVLDKISATKNLDCSTLEVLMEWTKRIDEAHRT